MSVTHTSRPATADEIAAEMDRRGAVIEQIETERVTLRRERDEARAYLKAFLYATIDPEDRRKDVQIHQANPSLGWIFTLDDMDVCPQRHITGSQVRRAMEIVGFDKLKIEPAGTTVADDHVAACRRATGAETQRDVLALAGKHLAVKLAEVYRAAGSSPADCQAIRDWMAAVAKSEGRP